MSRRAAIIRWLFVLGAFAVGMIFCNDLRLADDAIDLLPGEAVRGDLRMLKRMGLVDRLFITVSMKNEGGIPVTVSKKALQASTKKLGDLLNDSGQFSYVLARLPEGYEFSLFAGLQPSLPLLLDEGDIANLATMTSPEGIKAGLQNSFALLNSPAGIAMKKQVQVDPLGLITLALQKLNLMRSEYTVRIDEGFFMSKDGRSCLLVAESRKSLTDSEQAAAVEKILHAASGQALDAGIEATVIGSLPHTLANSRSIEKDLQLLLPLASVLMLLLFGVALRNIRFLVVVGVPYLAAPPAIALTSLFYDKLSGLALGFGIVLLGITVDVATHLYLAMTGAEGGSPRQAMKQVAKPLFYAVLTTAAVFVVLLFSQVPCHRQMALLAIFGVTLASLFAYLVIPAIAATQKNKPVRVKENHWLRLLSPRHPGQILAVWLVLVAFGLVTWPRLHYNGDLRGLDVPDQQVIEGERHFNATWGGGDEQAFVLATGSSLDEVLDRNYLVYRFLRESGVKKFQSFAPLLPGPSAQTRNQQGWQQFWEANRGDFEERFIKAAVARGFTEQAFLPFFHWLDTPPQPLLPEKFLGGPLQPLFSSMLKVPGEGVSEKDSYIAMTTIAIDDALLPQLLQFGEKTEGVRVLANKKWRAEVEHLLRYDVQTLSLIAGLLITLMVIYQFRNTRATLAVLAPVISSLAAMSIFCFLTGGQLNMMHLIMGLMVIGVSVDYGIFIVCAKLSGLEKVSERSVSLTAASSMIGFGVLAFAGHPALYALGVTVLIGVGVAWPTALWVSPALLVFGKKE
ncbi:MAG: MMPL family transporter [Desulforhopalus sp.]|nr:MMPL family transporter [Desulforhopalus sp.]